MKTRTAAALALVLLLTGVVRAETSSKTVPLLVAYDLASTSYIYCKQVGGSVDFVPKDRYELATTSGSSTTVTAYAAATQAPFDTVAVGSVLYFYIPQDYPSLAATQGPAIRYVTAKASADSITVDSAIELPTTGVTFGYTTQLCGTAATDGWFGVSGWEAMNTVVQIATINATSIDYELECRTCVTGAGSQLCTGPALVSGPTNKTAVGTFSAAWALAGTGQGPWDQCRFGMKVNTDTGAQSIFVLATRVQ